MTTDIKLLPCPFCGSENIDPKGWVSADSAGPACDDCGAGAGGVRDTLQDNIAAWNRRACVSSATEALQAEIEALRELCGMAYQLAGVHDAPEKWLDALSNAAAGSPFSTDGLLPYMPQAVCDAEAEAKALRAEVRELRKRQAGWERHVASVGCEYVRDGEYDALVNRRAERLAEALRGVLPFVVTDVLEHCGGNKCREQWCAGCMGDEYAAEHVERAMAAAQEARAALSKENSND